jgi:hypothetical protein
MALGHSWENPWGQNLGAAAILGKNLKAGVTYPGVIKNDKDFFGLAYESGFSVIEAPVLLPEESFYAIRDWYIANKNPMETIRYGFPRNADDWNVCLFNCATFPSYRGIPIPETTGNLRDYFPALEKMPGAKPWEPKP